MSSYTYYKQRRELLLRWLEEEISFEELIEKLELLKPKKESIS